MSIRGFLANVLGICVAAAALAGCAAPQEGPVPPSSAQSNQLRVQSFLRTYSEQRTLGAASKSRGLSWIAPEAKAKDILYLSNPGDNDVEILSYPAGTVTGKLAAVEDPTGLCTDPQGDLWVVNATTSKLVEYAHGSTKSKASLTDTGQLSMFGCAVDPMTGNLAVTDLGNGTDGGSFAVFTGAKGSPKKYTSSSLSYAYFCSYDASGNLFVDGVNNNYDFVLLELPFGATKAVLLTLSGSIGFPGGVAWDGEYLAIGDQEYESKNTSAIDEITVAGSGATIEGTVPLTGSCDVLQFAITGGDAPKEDQQGNALVAPDACSGVLGFYPYPTGGSPTKTDTGFQYPVAAAISLPPAGLRKRSAANRL